MRPNTTSVHPYKLQKEGRKTKIDVQADIRPALSQQESAKSVRGTQKLAMNLTCHATLLNPYTLLACSY